MPPKISVLMPVYNGETFLRESIESILNQSFQDYEFILIDDGSIDQTGRIISDCRDPRIKRIRNHMNIGLTRSLDMGLAEAQGEYIARQDADDISLPRRFERQVALLEKHPYVVLTGTSVEYIDENGVTLRQARRCQSVHFNRWRLFFGNHIAHSAAMFRRSAANQAGGYDTSLAYSQDYDFWARLSFIGEISQSEEILLKWRKHAKGISIQKNENQKRIGNDVIRRMIGKHLDREITLKEASLLRELPRRPMASEAELVDASHLLIDIWGDFRSKWRLNKADMILIRKDMAQRLASAASIQVKLSPKRCMALLLKSMQYYPGICLRGSFHRRLAKILYAFI